MEAWQKVWREGACPLIKTKTLKRLKRVLEEEDQRLIQGTTTTPPALACTADWPIEAACLLGICGWIEACEGLDRNEEPVTIGEVEEAFAALCHGTDQRMNEPAAVHYLLNWFDDTPRAEMIAQLLPEVVAEIERREQP